ncbi:hypothetical protein [Sphingobium xenophagum]|uniref:hypothetical protein n=1 Tax=Sphingobium xenophagum TaxID=121428 RepID=UPI00286CFD10|nr:hypothetical protein [Sphingobium xenophagum]
MDVFSSAVMFGNITLAHSMPSVGGIHSITSQWKSARTAPVLRWAIELDECASLYPEAAIKPARNVCIFRMVAQDRTEQNVPKQAIELR